MATTPTSSWQRRAILAFSFAFLVLGGLLVTLALAQAERERLLFEGDLSDERRRTAERPLGASARRRRSRLCWCYPDNAMKQS